VAILSFPIFAPPNEKKLRFAGLIERKNAQVAKLVDALCSGRSVGNHVMVRIHSWALKRSCKLIDLQDLFSFTCHEACPEGSTLYILAHRNYRMGKDHAGGEWTVDGIIFSPLPKKGFSWKKINNTLQQKTPLVVISFPNRFRN
jgi:hypothetical protein